MKKIIIGLLTIGTLSVQASMLEINGPLDTKFLEKKIEQDKTHFETLGDLFQKGTLPNLAKISNIAWSGRCFFAEKPNDPTNAGYIFRKSRTDAGPISQSYQASTYWFLSKAPNFYDNLSMEQVLALHNNQITFSDVKINLNRLEIKSDDLVSQVKISGPYLVENLIRTASDTGPIGGEADVSVRCYYFIPDLSD